MSEFYETLAARIEERFGEQVARAASLDGELTFEIGRDDVVEVARALRDEPDFCFKQLIDLCGVDYLLYGQAEWTTETATESGFSRGVVREAVIFDESVSFEPRRFAVVYHLLSLDHNARLRLRVYTGTDNPPVVQSVVDVWSSANWFEREAFDLFGILFDGHPDLRRILTPDDWTGHPLRKDYPVQVRKDAAAWSPLELTAEEFAANIRASRETSAAAARLRKD
jgi:NADH-quinone oxidoreductase subunit C